MGRKYGNVIKGFTVVFSAAGTAVRGLPDVDRLQCLENPNFFPLALSNASNSRGVICRRSRVGHGNEDLPAGNIRGIELCRRPGIRAVVNSVATVAKTAPNIVNARSDSSSSTR